MLHLLILVLSFSVFAGEQSFNRQFGSQSRPEPFNAEAFSHSALTYESIDWRNVQGKNWLGPVRNQANCGACVAFATIAVIEDQLTIDSRSLWKRDAFSQEALFTCGKGNCNSGWRVETAALVVEKIGVVDSACLPYGAGAAGKTVACGTFCENQDQRTLKIKSIIRPKGAAAIKEALKRGPLVTTMAVLQGFDSYTGGIFKAKPDAKYLGGHAVAIVGFNDSERYFIIKNSWGEDWGEKGYARMSYDDISGVGSEAIGYVLSESAEGFEAPLEDQYVRGILAIKGRLSDVELQKGSQTLQKINCKGSCTLDTKSLTDGEYTLVTPSSNGRLITRKFTVLNNPIQPTMALGAPRSFNYSYPQSGRIYFDVSFSGVIFPEHLILEIYQGSKMVYRRDFPDVYAFNRLGVNSDSLPNGVYEVVVKHRTFDKEVIYPTKTKVTIKN